MAFAKMFRFLKARIDWILFLILLVLTGLFIWLEVDEPAKIWENKPLTIKCNDPKINHPLASEQLIFLKNLLVALGIAFSCFLHIALFSSDAIGMDLPPNASLIQQRAFLIPFWRWIARFLVELLAGLILTGLPYVNVVISDRPVAPNFLAICKPQGLDFLCSNPDSEYWVEIICTTPVQMWLPAARTIILPNKMLVIFYYLMFVTFYRMIIKWDWKRMLNWGLFLQAINLAMMVGVGVVSVSYCHETDSYDAFLGCALLSSSITVPWIMIDYFKKMDEDDFPDEEKNLPRYWNDVMPNQNPSAMIGKGSTPQKDNSIDTPPSMSIYPQLPPELYEWKDIALGVPDSSINRY